MKKPDPLVVELNTKMFANAIKAGDACRVAGINPSTWSRWASGGVINLTKLRQMDLAIDKMISEADAAE